MVQGYDFDYYDEYSFYIDIGVRIEPKEADQDIFLETYTITKDDVNIVNIGKQLITTPFNIIKGLAETVASFTTVFGADDHDVYSFAYDTINSVLDEALQQPENKASAEKVKNYHITYICYLVFCSKT